MTSSRLLLNNSFDSRYTLSVTAAFQFRFSFAKVLAAFLLSSEYGAVSLMLILAL